MKEVAEKLQESASSASSAASSASDNDDDEAQEEAAPSSVKRSKNAVPLARQVPLRKVDDNNSKLLLFLML